MKSNGVTMFAYWDLRATVVYFFLCTYNYPCTSTTETIAITVGIARQWNRLSVLHRFTHKGSSCPVGTLTNIITGYA